MVAVALFSKSTSFCWSSLDSSFICSRSADSWIGVSGFLISCARRRATSPQAIERWAEITSVMSSNTTM
ncbi:hypothetical protein D3C87_2072330 [compost metagenome]